MESALSSNIHNGIGNVMGNDIDRVLVIRVTMMVGALLSVLASVLLRRAADEVKHYIFQRECLERVQETLL